jgi:uncharacterized protein DUF4154
VKRVVVGRKSLLPTGARRLILLSTVVCLAAPVRGDDAHPRTKVVARRKALFIEQFTRLVQWPPAVLPREAAFVLCIQGANDTAEELARIAAVHKFKERACEVRRPRSAADLAACHVLYLAAGEAPRLSETLGAVANKPILTVSDTPGFAERGVEFNLYEETRSLPQPGTYVGFELNVSAVKHSTLMFDPGLLSSGRRVDTGQENKPRGPGP